MGSLLSQAARLSLQDGGGLGFVLVSAWPVVGCLGLDVLLITVAFRLNTRRGAMDETLRLTPRNLTIDRVDHRGAARRWTFRPHRLQVTIDDPPAHESQLTLRSHGRSLAVGGFPTAEERAELARALREALAREMPAPG